MLKHKQWYRIGITLFVATVGCCSQASAAAAKSAAKATTTTTQTSQSSSTQIQSVAQSYTAATALQQGLIVELNPKATGSVTTVAYKDAKKMLGVVVPANSTAFSLSSTTATGQQVYVVTSGRYNVLVSNQNGTINIGDYVSISAADGIGMKADTVEPEILGRAVGSFDGKNNAISTTTLKTSDGKQLKIAIGTVAVDVGIGANPNQTNGDNGIPAFAQKLAITLVGKAITLPQLYISAAILIAGIGVVVSLLYGGIQTGMTAIGRNPLARKSIMRNLVQVIITGVMIFIGCLIAVYLILKL